MSVFCTYWPTHLCFSPTTCECNADAVNLEADLLAKYVERLLPGSASADLTPQWMAENGWNV